MIKQIFFSIVILIIAMNVFSNVDKLQNYSIFQKSAYTPIEIGMEDVQDQEEPKVGSTAKLFSEHNNFVPFKGLKDLPSKTLEEQPEPKTKGNKSSLENMFANKMFDVMNLEPRAETPLPISSNNVSARTASAPVKSKPLVFNDKKGIRKLTVGSNEGDLYNYLKRGLAGAESTFNPKQVTASGLKNTFGSGAWGKYQFIRRDHEKNIKQVTGLSMKEFLNNENAQDKYFKFHYEKELRPKLLKIRKMGLGKQYSDLELLGALHYRNNRVIPILQNDQANVKFNDNKINPTLNAHMSKVLKFAGTS